VIANRFKYGSLPAIMFSVVRLAFWAMVAAIRVTSRTLKKTVIFWIGFWIGYTTFTQDKLGRSIRVQTEDADT
jgi:hypothetical protein